MYWEPHGVYGYIAISYSQKGCQPRTIPLSRWRIVLCRTGQQPVRVLDDCSKLMLWFRLRMLTGFDQGEICWNVIWMSQLMSPSVSSFAFVLQNHDGNFVQGVSGSFPSIYEPRMVELLAIREALSWLKDLGFDNVVLESDCNDVIMALNSTSLNLSEFRLLLNIAFCCVHPFSTCHSSGLDGLLTRRLMSLLEYPCLMLCPFS